jgi:hypothetical protein
MPPFTHDLEASERGVVFAFPLHVEAAQRYFAERGITGAHDFIAR